MDYETARTNMIEQQIRPWNVLQMQTLNALGQVRREDFVPAQYKSLSFADVAIPVGGASDDDADKVMLEPKVAARMIESMQLQPTHRILEIGTGTGYLTALLATICEHVTSIEIDSQLTRQAAVNLAMAGISNVQLIEGDCFAFCHAPNQYVDQYTDQNANENGWKFDRVLITGSVPEIGNTFLNMINAEGCVVGIEGYNPAMQVVIYRATAADEAEHRSAHKPEQCRRQSLFETSAPRLLNVDEKPSFIF